MCVDYKKWNENNLPIKLRSLIAKGVEFMFCEDIRSYTKLIPVMKAYPNDYIITVDDDIIYDKKTIENLLEASSSSPDAVCCLNASRPIIKNGYPCEYENGNRYILQNVVNILFSLVALVQYYTLPIKLIRKSYLIHRDFCLYVH